MVRFSRLLTLVAALATFAVASVAYAITDASSPVEPPTVLEPTFSIVLTTVESGIRARCEIGCRWEDLEANFPAGEYVITSIGVHPAAADLTHSEEADFSFHLAVEDEAGGIRARCGQGCRWISIGGKSPIGEYRITEAGIEPITP